jgi:hypothetical protein
MSAYLQINLKIDPKNRNAAAAVYTKYKQPFLTKIKGAKTKQLLLRDEDVQVLHGFEKKEDAQDYLKSSLFSEDVVKELKPLLEAEPSIKIYDVAG